MRVLVMFYIESPFSNLSRNMTFSAGDKVNFIRPAALVFFIDPAAALLELLLLESISSASFMISFL
jgi:hypothetical protein